MGSFSWEREAYLLSLTSLKRTMLLLLLSVFTYVSADADAQVPIPVPGVQYYRYPTPAVDTPIVTPALRSPIVTPALNNPIVTPALGPTLGVSIVQPASADETGVSLTPALRSPIVTQALNTPIITPALGAPPIVLPAGQDGVALRSQFLQPSSLGGGFYYTHSPYTPSTIYYTPNTNFKKTPEDLTKLIKAYTDLSPETKKFISERSQGQDWHKQAIVEFFENNLSIGCVKAFMQEILLENGCTEDYGKRSPRDKTKVRLGGDGLESSDD